MMLRPVDEWYLRQVEPAKSCLEFMRQHILHLNEDITETWQYGMPFFLWKKKRLCYLWIHKEKRLPYLGIVDGNKIDHPDLIQEKRARMKILLIDPDKDIPLHKINEILKQAQKVLTNNP